MIIMNLKGGLGNIMFQYALGRHLSIKNKSDLRFNIRSYKDHPLGDYSFSLEAFNIDVRNRLITFFDFLRFKIRQKRSDKMGALTNYLFADESKYVQEAGFHFNPNVLTLKDNVFLDGYWQNEKYFIDIKDILLKDFTVKSPLQGRNKEMTEKIMTTNSVSIHVRGRDRLSDPKVKAYFREITKEYYDKAISIVAAKVSKPVFFVFSDDMAWAEKIMQFLLEKIYIKGNDELPHEDLRLMSLCKHHITANSTFSWWGAWLAQNPNKIVITPQKWSNDKRDMNERIPAGWIKI